MGAEGEGHNREGATFGEAELTLQERSGEREIAADDMSLVLREERGETFFVEADRLEHLKYPAGERDKVVGCIEMGVAVEESKAEALADESEGGAFHKSGIRFVEIAGDMGGEDGREGSVGRAREREDVVAVDAMDARVGGGGGGVAIEEDLLAFAVDSDDMDIGDGSELPASEREVDHRRGLDEDAGGGSKKSRPMLQNIRGALVESHHLVAGGIATGGVDKEEIVVSGMLRQPLDAVGAMAGDVGEMQGSAIVPHRRSEAGVAFDIVDMSGDTSESQCVDAHTAGDVGDAVGAGNEMISLIEGGGVGRALLTVEARREPEIGAEGEGGPFGGSLLTALQLLSHPRHIDLRERVAMEQETDGVVVEMSVEEIDGSLIHR